MDDVEQRTIRKLLKRLLPLLIVCYFAAYLDRVNIGFAALSMNKALGLTATAFGFGAGIFFLAYFLFEVPSNIALARFGARKWIARIMASWALVSALTAFVKGEYGFYGARLLLGAAEAGFFPGVIFYLTLWFPAQYRGRVISYFLLAVPVSSLIGAPVSGYILGLDGALGLAGWQWLFLIEAVPALVMAFVVLMALPDRPEQASWLESDERTWLTRQLDGERRQREGVRDYSIFQALTNRRVLILSLVYFGDMAGLYALGFWLPQIIKSFGLSNAQTGLVTAVPYFVGAVGMVLWSWSSDRRRERKLHVASALVVLAIGLAGSAYAQGLDVKLAWLCVTAVGVFATEATFWTLPTAFLSGTAAAAGIAVINSIGNLAGFLGPYAMGALKDATNSFAPGLFAIAALAVVGFVIMMVLPHLETERHVQPEPAE